MTTYNHETAGGQLDQRQIERDMTDLEGLLLAMQAIFRSAWDKPEPDALAFAVVLAVAFERLRALKDELGLTVE